MSHQNPRALRIRRRNLFTPLALALLGLDAVSIGCHSRSSDPHAATGNDAGHAAGNDTSAGASMGPIGGAGAASDTARGGLGGAATTVAPGGGAGGSDGGQATTSAGAGSSNAGAAQAGSTGSQGGSAASTAGSGNAGAPAENGGESSGGAGGAEECRNLCSDQAPACCTADLHCVTAEQHCRIDVFDLIELPHDYDALEQELAAVSDHVSLSISDGDVKSAAAEPFAAGRFEFDLNDRASASYGDMLQASFGHGFRLSCNDKPLFDGIFWFEEGQAVFDTPVLSVAAQTKDGATVLELGAFSGAWSSSFGDGGTTADRERIDRPELRAAFCARGILGVLD